MKQSPRERTLQAIAQQRKERRKTRALNITFALGLLITMVGLIWMIVGVSI